MASLQGQSAFVTGGGSGIGRAICLDLTKLGCRVTAADLDVKAAEETAALAGPLAAAARCDVTSPASQEAAVADHVRRCGGLDIAVLNAGIAERGDLLTARDDSWRATLDVDLTAVLDGVRVCGQAMAPGGRRRGAQGVIVAVSSAGGFFLMPPSPVYAAAKAGVVHATRSLAGPMLKRFNIRITALCPEFVDTPLVRNVRASGSAFASALFDPANKLMLTADKVSEAALALILDPRRNGQCLVVRLTGEWQEPIGSSHVLRNVAKLSVAAAPAAWRDWARAGFPTGGALPGATRAVAVQRLSNDFRAATALVPDWPLPSQPLGEGQVLLRTVYAGINASDVNYTSGRYHASVAEAASQLPYAAGFEAVSVVAAVGPGVRGYAPGQAVATMTAGSFAELTVRPASALLPVPAPLAAYVALLTSGLTASIGLEEAGRMRRGETVLITAAAGGAGQFCVQLAAAAGCHVIATVGGEDKAALVRSLGAHRVINYRREDLKTVLRAEYPRGVDVVWETIGGDWFTTCVNALAPKGRLLVIGAMSQYKAAGGWKPQPHVGLPEKLLARSASVTGFFLVQYPKLFKPHLDKLVALHAAGKLRIVMDEREFVGLEAVPDAVDRLQGGESVGKVCVRISKDVPPAADAKL